MSLCKRVLWSDEIRPNFIERFALAYEKIELRSSFWSLAENWSECTQWLHKVLVYVCMRAFFFFKWNLEECIKWKIYWLSRALSLLYKAECSWVYLQKGEMNMAPPGKILVRVRLLAKLPLNEVGTEFHW